MKTTNYVLRPMLIMCSIFVTVGCGKQTARTVNGEAAATPSAAASNDLLTTTDKSDGLALAQYALTNHAIDESNAAEILNFLKEENPAFDLANVLGAENKALADGLNRKLAATSRATTGVALAASTSHGRCALLSLALKMGNKIPGGVGGLCGILGHTVSGLLGGIMQGVMPGAPVVQPQPIVMQPAQPVVVQSSQPIVINQSQTVIVQQAQPVVAVQPQQVVVSQPQKVIVPPPQSVVVSQNQPTPVQQTVTPEKVDLPTTSTTQEATPVVTTTSSNPTCGCDTIYGISKPAENIFYAKLNIYVDLRLGFY